MLTAGISTSLLQFRKISVRYVEMDQKLETVLPNFEACWFTSEVFRGGKYTGCALAHP